MHSYEWAVNKTKLSQAIKFVTDQSKINPKIEVNEETIKENYIARAGLLAEEEAQIKATARPRVTSRGNVRVTSKK